MTAAAVASVTQKPTTAAAVASVTQKIQMARTKQTGGRRCTAKKVPRVKKHHRHRPQTAALKIRKYQKSTVLLIRKLPSTNKLKAASSYSSGGDPPQYQQQQQQQSDMPEKQKGSCTYSNNSFSVLGLSDISNHYLVSLFKDTGLGSIQFCAVHQKEHVIISSQDIEHARRMRGRRA